MPAKQQSSARGRVGDLVAIPAAGVGKPARTGTVTAVVGDSGRERYAVRWQDGHETTLYDVGEATFSRPPRKR
jgi:Domain of unknown function (DUF1918)